MTKIITEQITAYDAEIFEQVGSLLPQLDPSFKAEKMTNDHFDRYFADNSERALLVARMGNLVVGTGTLNLVVEQAPEATSAYMGGFVVDTPARGTGAAPALWRRLLHTSRQMGAAKMTFNTESARSAAIKFYEKMGARQLDGTLGHYEIPVPEAHIPDDVHAAYGLADPVVTPIPNGLVNKTFLIEDMGETSILQRLNDAFDPRLLSDSAMAAAHLAKHGWEAPEVLPTPGDAVSYQDFVGSTWRRIQFIESDAYDPNALTHEQMRQIGQLLARWHHTMAQLDYEPEYTIPHFHDTPFFADTLARYRFEGKFDRQIDQKVSSLLAAYQDLPPLPAGDQLIHGDPQLSNVLMRGGAPLTYIDLDTIMRGSIWLDIGDLLRSVAEADIQAGRSPDVTKLERIIDGYFAASPFKTDYKRFYNLSMLAAKTIAAELAMRFVIDIADDTYFAWDKSKHASRRDNHLYKVQVQEQVIAAIETRERTHQAYNRQNLTRTETK